MDEMGVVVVIVVVVKGVDEWLLLGENGRLG